MPIRIRPTTTREKSPEISPPPRHLLERLLPETTLRRKAGKVLPVALFGEGSEDWGAPPRLWLGELVVVHGKHRQQHLWQRRKAGTTRAGDTALVGTRQRALFQEARLPPGLSVQLVVVVILLHLLMPGGRQAGPDRLVDTHRRCALRKRRRQLNQ